MHMHIRWQLFNGGDIGRELSGPSGLLDAIPNLLPLSLIDDSLRIFLYEKEEVLQLASDEKSVPFLDYSMCANPHLLNVLPDKSVIWMVHL